MTEIIELTMAQAATFVGVTTRQMMNYMNGPYPPPRTQQKKFRTDELRQWHREKIRRDMTVTVSGDPEALDGIQELARKNKELADKTALENEKRRGELIETAKVRDGWIKLRQTIRSRLARIPVSVAPLVTHEDDQAVVYEIIEDEVRAALTESSEMVDG
jgi:phage terminase Nu1 subunit (DNA packaging protein)